MRKSAQAHHSTLAELNITPLLDLVFVLLVIFIITTPQMMNNLEMTLPSGKAPPQKPSQPPPRIQRLVVDAQGRTSLNDELLSAAALREKLQHLKSVDPEVRVIVKADDDADYQSMVNVLDLLQQLEITKVGLGTDAPDPPPKGSH